MRNKVKARLKRAAYMFLTFIIIAALIVAGVIIGIDIVDMFRAVTVNRQVQEMYHSGLSRGGVFAFMGRAYAGEAPAGADGMDEFAPDTSLNVQEDFALLYEENPDIIGWLTAGGDIDLPVVQRDNEYYLNHNFYGQADSNGTVFLNEMNVFYPRDKVLLIHGHNMRSGAMFGQLRKYADEAYMRGHALITFRTIYDEQTPYYVPVAAFDASMQPQAAGYFDVTPMNFATDEQCRDYLEQVLEKSYWSAPADVTYEDELLMLITCSYKHEDGRFMLLCRKLREDESPEQMEELYKNN